MDIKEVIHDGRKYRAYVSPDEQQGAHVIIGPPEGLVDELGLPAEIATKLHNALYYRGVFTSGDASKKGVLTGVIQEVYMLEAQILLEKFQEFEKETVLIGGSHG